MEFKNLLSGIKKIFNSKKNKKKLRGRDQFSEYKVMILYCVSIIEKIPLKFRIKLFNNVRMTQGKLGLVIRYILVKSLAQKCGDNVSIQPGVYLYSPDRLVVGNNVSIHPMSYIDCTGGVEIGNDVSIAHGTTIMSTEHKYEDVKILIKDQGYKYNKTVIGSDVWIGAASRILAGVRISDGCVIGASAVVTKNTTPNGVYVGVPAKKRDKRKDSNNESDICT